MKDIFRQIIVDFHGTSLPKPFKRDISIPVLPEAVKKAVVLVGMRRTGKTWSLFQIMNDLLKAGIRKERLLYINFEDERLLPLKTTDLNTVFEAYSELYPQLVGSTVYLFFDEIHEVAGWELFVRRLLDTLDVKIYITGSSAKMLSREIATTLRGRTITIEIYPYSFAEYLHCHDTTMQNPLTSEKQAWAGHHLSDYLRYGGFPESVFIDRSMHHKLLQNYIDTVIYRDIVDRHQLTNLLPLKDLIRYSLQNAASLVSISKVFNTFKSLGYAIGKNSVYDYFSYLEDAYCLFLVPLFSHSHRQQAVHPRKIYAVDQGLISAYSVKPEFDRAARLENAVFSSLKRQGDSIYYFKTKTGKEIDFLIQHPDGSIELIQVCESLRQSSTRNRELNAMREALSSIGLTTGTVVTLDDKELINESGVNIQIIPAVDWFLRDGTIR